MIARLVLYIGCVRNHRLSIYVAVVQRSEQLGAGIALGIAQSIVGLLTVIPNLCLDSLIRLHHQ